MAGFSRVATINELIQKTTLLLLNQIEHQLASNSNLFG
jgi:hypothetical protein